MKFLLLFRSVYYLFFLKYKVTTKKKKVFGIFSLKAKEEQEWRGIKEK